MNSVVRGMGSNRVVWGTQYDVRERNAVRRKTGRGKWLEWLYHDAPRSPAVPKVESDVSDVRRTQDLYMRMHEARQDAGR